MIPATSNQYRHVLSLARGGMGQVELAMKEEGRFRRLYAIKRPHLGLIEDAGFREMFVEEARLAGLIRHRNVVSVIDVGEDDSGLYQVMEFVEGTTVAALIEKYRQETGFVPVHVALSIMAQAAQGLHAAHETTNNQGTPLGLVHRDVSPQNILLGYDGGVRVTDFGVAKALGSSSQTESGVLKGKMGYMSPEQLRFQSIDRRSDVFAMGVVLFELLSSERLYHKKPLAILEGDVPDIGEHRSDVPPELVGLLFEMLSKAPSERPATAKVVAERLNTIRQELELRSTNIQLDSFIQEAFAEESESFKESLQQALTVQDARTLSALPTKKNRIPIVALVAIALLGLVLSAAFLFWKSPPKEVLQEESNAVAKGANAESQKTEAVDLSGVLQPIAEDAKMTPVRKSDLPHVTNAKKTLKKPTVRRRRRSKKQQREKAKTIKGKDVILHEW